MFATVVYTGPAPHTNGLHRANEDDREEHFDDTFAGYGTLVEVFL